MRHLRRKSLGLVPNLGCARLTLGSHAFVRQTANEFHHPRHVWFGQKRYFSLLSFHPPSTAYPASSQTAKPPNSGVTRLKPASNIICAARALVSSAGQVQ